MKIQYILFLVLVCGIWSCRPGDRFPDEGTNILDPNYGSVEFDFEIPELNLPEKGLHRVDLSLAKTLDSLYRKEYCSAANVSDYKQKYSFNLLPGRYYYQAGFTCTCGGDSCLYAGFPGGTLSIWWTSGWIDIEKGKVLSKKLRFQ